MIEALRLVVIDCAILVAAGIALALLLRFGRAALDALPTSRARRAQIERISPVAGTAIAVLFAVMAARWILRTDDARAWIALGAAVALVLALSWGPLRDVFEGVYLRAGKGLVVGDRIQVAGVRGRVQRLGLRGVHVEGNGELAIVPYRTLTAQPLLRTPGVDHPAFHVFRVARPRGRSIADARRLIVETALLHHWASVARQPHVVATDDGELEITVFAIDPDRVTDLEHELREALESLEIQR